MSASQKIIEAPEAELTAHLGHGRRKRGEAGNPRNGADIKRCRRTHRSPSGRVSCASGPRT